MRQPATARRAARARPRPSRRARKPAIRGAGREQVHLARVPRGLDMRGQEVAHPGVGMAHARRIERSPCSSPYRPSSARHRPAGSSRRRRSRSPPRRPSPEFPACKPRRAAPAGCRVPAIECAGRTAGKSSRGMPQSAHQSSENAPGVEIEETVTGGGGGFGHACPVRHAADSPWLRRRCALRTPRSA